MGRCLLLRRPGEMKYLLSVLFIVSGIFHFLKTEPYLKMMPGYLPYPRELIYISGIASLVLGVLLLTRKPPRFVAWGTILYLIAVFPANVQMALHPEIFPEIPAWLSWARLPFQGVLIRLAYNVCR